MTRRLISPSELQLEPLPEEPESLEAQAEILSEGQPTAKIVPGAVLEAAIGVGKRFLLFTTDGTPFEDALNICYLSEELELIEVVRIGATYSTGFFSDLDLSDPKLIGFGFMGGITWRLELLDRRERCLPFLSDPRRVPRRPFFSRFMRLYGKPLPDA